MSTLIALSERAETQPLLVEVEHLPGTLEQGTEPKMPWAGKSFQQALPESAPGIKQSRKRKQISCFLLSRLLKDSTCAQEKRPALIKTKIGNFVSLMRGGGGFLPYIHIHDSSSQSALWCEGWASGLWWRRCRCCFWLGFVFWLALW